MTWKSSVCCTRPGAQITSVCKSSHTEKILSQLKSGVYKKKKHLDGLSWPSTASQNEVSKVLAGPKVQLCSSEALGSLKPLLLVLIT